MNVEVATIITEGFLKGACDVFDAMLSQAFSFEAEAPSPFDAAGAGDIFCGISDPHSRAYSE